MCAPQIVVCVSGGSVQEVFASDACIQVMVVDFDVQPDDGYADQVQFLDANGRLRSACVGGVDVHPLEMLRGTEAASALAAAEASYAET